MSMLMSKHHLSRIGGYYHNYKTFLIFQQYELPEFQKNPVYLLCICLINYITIVSNSIFFPVQGHVHEINYHL